MVKHGFKIGNKVAFVGFDEDLSHLDTAIKTKIKKQKLDVIAVGIDVITIQCDNISIVLPYYLFIKYLKN